MRIRSLVLITSLTLAPLAARGAVIVTGSLTHELEVAPGGSYEGTIDVQNPGAEPQEVRAYQTDYSFSSDGAVQYGDPGKLPRSNARWMTLSPQDVTIPPAQTVTVRFTIQVPNDATMKGTYWSVIMVEPVASSADSGSGPKNTGVGVSQVLRYAVQIVTHIGVSGTRQMKFSRIQLVAAPEGKTLLLVDTEDTGERWLRGTMWVDLYDADGKHVGKIDGGMQRMYPGTSVRFRAELAGLAPATYKALIVVDCGGDDVFGANVNLVLKP